MSDYNTLVEERNQLDKSKKMLDSHLATIATIAQEANVDASTIQTELIARLEDNKAKTETNLAAMKEAMRVLKYQQAEQDMQNLQSLETSIGDVVRNIGKVDHLVQFGNLIPSLQHVKKTAETKRYDLNAQINEKRKLCQHKFQYTGNTDIRRDPLYACVYCGQHQ